ncbi:hypothetical protein F4775DRAFT_590365 [Biscogniauxia sp. FL1348]|nr:hypothetical protein F4775DRAFT_590365 [Biscogniauxia sp. FL1348]
MTRGALKPPSMLGAILDEEFADKPKKKVTFVSPEISRSSSSTTTTTSEEDSSADDNATASKSDSTYTEVESDEETSETDEEEDGPAPLIAKRASMAATNSSEAPEWTHEEDRTIVGMKMEGKSWANISKELSRSKKEVQRRHKALSSDAEKLGLTIEKLDRLWAKESEDDEDGPGPEKSGPAKGAKPKDGSKEKPKPKPKPKATKPNKTKNKPAKSPSPSPSPPSSSSSSSSEEEEEEEEDDPIAEHWAHQRYLYNVVYSAMFPDQRPLRPDAHWSAADCRTLAVLEARRRALWWRFLQSDFHNATGRVVDPDVLRAKFEEADEEEEE